MQRKVKVGPKGRIAIIPEVWIQVTSGNCKENDRYADTTTARFVPVDKEDIGLPYNSFDCLIRENKLK